MILYPLNALVEDQIRRLRVTVDDPKVQAWLDKHRGGNRILFGRYTGAAPVSGDPSNHGALERLRRHLDEVCTQSDELKKQITQGHLDAELKNYFPDIDGGEMWSRWDMQETPPDILITNYSMLNIMLMRSIEASMFERTRHWLEEDQDNRFFLVVDELHSYRGTPGTEVAYILRLLLNRLGLGPDSEQLVIIATSASINDDPESHRFLREFFGRDRFSVIGGQEVPPLANARLGMLPYREAFAEFARKLQVSPLDPMCPPAPESASAQKAMEDLSLRLGQSPASNTRPERL